MKQRGLDFGTPPEPEPAPRPLPRRRALTVSELTDRIQGVLEVEFHDVWVEGEVSNLKIAASGHWYFSLKDERAQLRAVVWKTAARLIRFRPKDGMKVLARGELRVYPPRGEYQISIELLEPLGKGSLQQAFEELKAQLEREGLFDPARKRRLPLLPRRIGVVSSPGGAVIRDILRVLETRYANLEVLIYPARVQGAEASEEIVKGIAVLNRIPGLDVLIVARGGGSIEDLWCFNEERVARALAASRVPTISAVGHETDFTIADFVADLRAATPSAAAEQVVQAKEELAGRVAALTDRLVSALELRLARTRHRVEAVTSHRVFEAERGRLRTLAQQIDDLVRRAEVGRRPPPRAEPRARAPGRGTPGQLPLGSTARRAARASWAASRTTRRPRAGRARVAARHARPRQRQARQPLAAGRAGPGLRSRLGLGRRPTGEERRGRGRGRRAADSGSSRRAGRHGHTQGGRVSKQAPTFETALEQLEDIVQKLEKGELALEESLKLYEEGIRLSRLCHAKLEEAEGKIELLLKDAKGEPVADAEGRPRSVPFKAPDE